MPRLILDRRRLEPAPESLGQLLREKLIGAIVIAVVTTMVGSISWNVDYLVKQIPKQFADLNDRVRTNEFDIRTTKTEVKGLQENMGRNISILEKYDERLRRLEQSR